MKEILERLLAGEFSVDEALRALDTEHVEQVGELARLDPDRMRRKGVPEVVLASGKTPELTAELALRLLDVTGVALVSRVTAEHASGLAAAAPHGVRIGVFGSGRRRRRGAPRRPARAVIGI